MGVNCKLQQSDAFQKMLFRQNDNSILEGGLCAVIFLPICLYFKLNHVRLRDEVRNKDQFLRNMRHITTISSFSFFF